MKKLIVICVLLICLLMFCGCTTIEVENPEKNIKAKVHFFMVDPAVQGFERVWSQTDYLAVNKAGSKVSSETAEVIRVLVELGFIVPVVAP